MHAYIHVCMYVCMYERNFVSTLPCVCAFIPYMRYVYTQYVCTYTQYGTTYIHTYILRSIAGHGITDVENGDTYMHACIHTYIHTYLGALLGTVSQMLKMMFSGACMTSRNCELTVCMHVCMYVCKRMFSGACMTSRKCELTVCMYVCM